MSDLLRPDLALAADMLADLAGTLDRESVCLDSGAEVDAFRTAAVDARQLARTLRNLVHFAGSAGARGQRVGACAPGGVRPPARPAGPDRTGPSHAPSG